MNQYRYSPLQKDRSVFRLLSLLPGPTSADIEMEIFHVKRSSKPKYEALSYVWGPPERTDVALVREPVKPQSQVMEYLGLQKRKEDSESTAAIGLTRNLAVALRHLRHPGKPKVLWIDALCINQDDLPERGAEVLEMGSIFSNAKQVIVWLGSSSGDSQLAINSLGRLGEGIVYSAQQHHVSYKTDCWAESLVDNAIALKSNAPSWIAIRDLLSREWFTRLWVFQEIGLAKSATVFVGKDRLDWELFEAALYWIWTILPHLNQLIRDLAIEDFASSSISGFLNITAKGDYKVRSIFGLLEMTMKLSCFDPRDRLFAIRGLLLAEDRDLIIPDYSKSVEDTFTDFNLRYLQETGDGNILKRCLLQMGSSNLQMPSWVSDLNLTNLPTQINRFYTSGHSKLTATNDGESLGVQAVKIATITSLTSFTTPSNTDPEVIELCRSWKKKMCVPGVYIGGGSAFNAFVETILCGRIRGLLPSQYGDLTSLEENRKILDGLEVGQREDKDENEYELDFEKSKFAKNVRTSLRGRSFFKTREGFFGVCPESVIDGDQVFVILGCSSPIVLRPVAIQGKTCHRIVGESYVPGIMHAEALLGQQPLGWSMSYKSIERRVWPVFEHENTITQEDPRAPLPAPWRYWYEPQKTFPKMKRKIPKYMLRMSFENVETKKNTRFDPRLTPEALRERGVDLQEIVLI